MQIGEFSTICADLWKNLSGSEKEIWEEKSKEYNQKITENVTEFPKKKPRTDESGQKETLKKKGKINIAKSSSSNVNPSEPG